jgi:hypothetical protein
MPGGTTNDVFSAFDSLSPPALATSPAPTSFPPVAAESPVPGAALANPNVDEFFAPKQSEAPAPAAATAKPLTANQFTPLQPQTYSSTLRQQRAPQRELAQREAVPRETVINVEHPFRQYWGMPNDPQTKITGKPISVAQLFAGTRSSAVRCQLLHAYWELSGRLAIYHFRCETERLATGAGGAQQDGTITMLREQCRTAELEFIKQQWVVAELWRQCKGRTLRESELPIPTDVPLYPRYQTFADKIARTERTQYLGRMIPIQEQLIESKNGTWKAASGMTQSASQPLFALLNQRTTAFLDLTKAVIEYNKMIAEYATETIPPNAGQHQLVRAVVRTPGSNTSPTQQQSPQMATSGVTLTQYDAPVGVIAEPVAQVAYQYQVPADRVVPEEKSEDTPDAIEDQSEPSIPAMMLDF